MGVRRVARALRLRKRRNTSALNGPIQHMTTSAAMRAA